MRKVPWGILAGFCAILIFFATIGLIAGNILVSMIIKNTGVDDGVLGTWWIVLLIVVDVLAAIGFGVCMFFYIRKTRMLKSVKREEGERHEEIA